ncbi:hypothetical protein MMC34_007711 [Xylographa carneopallida]|nr:hypothetical protein [Xylographa carneopallida]
MYTPPEDNPAGDGSYQQPGGSAPPQPPPAPRPSTDVGMTTLPDTLSSELEILATDQPIDIFTMSPIIALKMLCSLVEEMVQITGDIPPTPPVSLPNTPKMPVLQENRGRLTRQACMTPNSEGKEYQDVPITSRTPIGSPEAHPAEPFHIIGNDTQPLYVQEGALTRKFYSKRPPPISLEEYLLRLHRYCPMSTAVYLATSLYIHKLAIVERIIPVTRRNAHRLVLAGLRVAMKALEDLSYPHRRFAKVGGVSEPELGRLEISFCFLTDFELKVGKETLHKHAEMMRDGANFQGLPKSFQPVLPSKRRMTIRTIVHETASDASAPVAG